MVDNVTRLSSLTTPSSTIYSGAEIKKYHEEWIVFGSLTIPLALACLYVALTQIAYFLIKSIRKKRDKTAKTGAGNPNTNDRNVMLISTVNIIAAVCAFLRTGIDMRFFYGRDNDYGCTVSIIYETLTQTFSLLTAYYVL